MPGDADRGPRRWQDGTAVSSGESSAATPQPALESDALTAHNLSGQPIPGSAPPQSCPAKRDSSANDATLVETRKLREGGFGIPNQVYTAIGATVLEVGTVLGGRYEIQQLLRMGGMSAVYKARDAAVDRTLGLKVIRPDLAWESGDSGALQARAGAGAASHAPQHHPHL